MAPNGLDSSETSARRPAAASKLLRLLLPVAVLVLGWIGFAILSIEPEQAKQPPAEPRPLKTKVLELKARDYPTVIRTQGTIRPHDEVGLTAQVPGRILQIGPGFEDGAFFSLGDVLVELDATDYATAVVVAEAQLARAIAAHAQEEIRAKQARLNWEDLGYEEEPSDLVLRLPQLREAKANVDAATAQVERAKRDLERTKVRAPFDGRVRQRLVGVGQSVGSGTALGTVFATDFAEVRLPITARDMALLDLPETPAESPVDVELRDALNPGNETVWRAKIVRTEGALDQNTLELFAIARIDDPFGRQSGHPPLRIGQPVLGSVPGRVLTNVIAVPRVAVRQLDRIFLVNQRELTLHGRTIFPIWSNEEHLVIRDPAIPDGSFLATTHLVYAPDGAKVEIIPDITDTNLTTTTPAKATSNAQDGSKNKS